MYCSPTHYGSPHKKKSKKVLDASRRQIHGLIMHTKSKENRVIPKYWFVNA